MTEINIEEMIDSADLLRPAPTEEPARQYYYIKTARQLIKEQSLELGRPLTACSICFGCQMNARDSEKLMGILKDIGYVESETEDSDFVIYNTCTVRDNADQRLYGRLGYAGGIKKHKPWMKVAVCGL